MNQPFIIDLTGIPIKCFGCQKEIIFNGPALAAKDTENSTGKYSIYELEPEIHCPECHKKIDYILVPKEDEGLWSSRVKQGYEKELKQTYSPEEISKTEAGEGMGKKVLLHGYSCEYCNHAVTSDKPVAAELMARDTVWLYNIRHKCPECLSESKTVTNPILWEHPLVKKPTVSEIMTDYQKEAKRMDTSFKFLIFFAIWFAAGLSVYGLSFVPWIPILISFWVLTKELTYALTRWYSLLGLLVTLLIFYQWHKQAIRDKIDYLRNIYSTRRRYRKMVQRKEEMTEDEVRSFVDSANGRLDEIVEKPNDKDRVEVSENEIPF